jgi:trehalose/maltose hydrolase-like predicted phosphorylase
MTSIPLFTSILCPTSDKQWIIEEAEFDPLREVSRGSRFAISNGFLGIRGARALHREGRWVGTSRTLIAGLFDVKEGGDAIPTLVGAPNWFKVQILIDGVRMAHDQSDSDSQGRILDLRRGLLLGSARLSNGKPRTVGIQSLHLASLGQRAISLQLVQMHFDQLDADITLEVSLEAADAGLSFVGTGERVALWRTASGQHLSIETTLALQVDGVDRLPTSRTPLQWTWRWKSIPGQVVSLTRMVAVKRDITGALLPSQSVKDIPEFPDIPDWARIVAAHETAWAERWDLSDVEIDGDSAAQKAVRFALYHLNGAANPEDEHVSIAARALTGEDYRGHVFWDTEIYLLPFYIMTWPAAARTLLMYRYHTLDGARAKASALGWRGALYAWESALTGAETCPTHVIGPDRKVVEVKCGTQEQHISADVAYAVWQYWQATADDDFMRDAGVEIIFETARFWSSRALPEPDGYCHIRGVIGPDEYHESIDDNAFTNVMARDNIRHALALVQWMKALWPEHWVRLTERIGVSDIEQAQWRTVAERIVSGFDPKTGLFEQFAGFLALDDLDLSKYAGRSVPIDIILGAEVTRRSQVVKQADVVALLALLPDAFPESTGLKNFDYYALRCSHGSSLSRAMHGVVAARLGKIEAALDYFRLASAIDLDDSHAAIDGGVHIAALGGVWSVVVFGFAGLALHPEHLSLQPSIPAGWQRVRFPVQWRGRHLSVQIEHADNQLQVTMHSGAPMTVVVWGNSLQISCQQPLCVSTRPQPG